MADDILAEALARIEAKMDAIIKHHSIPVQPLNLPGQICPVCKMFIEYQVDINKQVVVRKCMCSTGKFVFTVQNPIDGVLDGKAPNPTPVSASIEPEPVTKTGQRSGR